MRRSEYLALARRLLAHIENGTTDSAESIKHIPVQNYVDPARWRREMDYIFKRLPLLLAFTCEMPRPGDYKSMTILNVPVLMMRGEDAVTRAFIGVCAHRGTILTEQGKGQCDSFTCPYHGWTFDLKGSLTGVASRHKFGEIDRQSRHLTQLPCVERAGLIFVSLNSDTSIDLENYLGGMLAELEYFRFENWHMYKQNELPTSNWKVAHDGYLEGYHFSTLHPNTIAKQVMSNIMAYDAYGPHQRVCFPTHKIAGLRSKPEQEWETDEGATVVRTIFPNVSFAISDHGGMVSQLLPGPTPDASRTIQNHIYAHPPANDEERAQIDAAVSLFINAVEKEDNWVCERIQRGLLSGGNKDFVFGRNELGLHRLHEWIDYYVSLSLDSVNSVAHLNRPGRNGHITLSAAERRDG
jgi:phenylpropionate dioxygenase-like ring-hydroxylating dioxygenase large terminal subunit